MVSQAQAAAALPLCWYLSFSALFWLPAWPRVHVMCWWTSPPKLLASPLCLKPGVWCMAINKVWTECSLHHSMDILMSLWPKKICSLAKRASDKERKSTWVNICIVFPGRKVLRDDKGLYSDSEHAPLLLHVSNVCFPKWLVLYWIQLPAKNCIPPQGLGYFNKRGEASSCVFWATKG